jgi:hypothetical protein
MTKRVRIIAARVLRWLGVVHQPMMPKSVWVRVTGCDDPLTRIFPRRAVLIRMRSMPRNISGRKRLNDIIGHNSWHWKENELIIPWRGE